MYQLQPLFSNKIYDRMLSFSEIERVVEEKVVASFKIFFDNRLEGLRKIAKHLRTVRVRICVRTLHFPGVKQKCQVTRSQNIYHNSQSGGEKVTAG
jgi:hypothetical protein